ncbi:BTAD domain-containing putative transcriptional regulator [Streptacidiphilus sp. N1-3]|uniref:BTAD domain-containing putative transcriptional regulator n=1 Tax=Streptacidiphilus alkalitolerans TaxID=3342712 RepID=A0ABV6WV55_9ACTN
MRPTAAPQCPTEATATAEPPYLAFLGRTRGWSGGCPLLTGSPRQQAVLAMLALRAGQEVSAEELVDGLYGEGTYLEDRWGWTAEELRREADRLRALLAGSAERLYRTEEGYLLDIAPDRVDAIAFERLVGAAHALRTGSPADAADLLQRAFGLWRGTPLSGIPGPFAEGERIRLQAVHRIAAELRPLDPPLAW